MKARPFNLEEAIQHPEWVWDAHADHRPQRVEVKWSWGPGAEPYAVVLITDRYGAIHEYDTEGRFRSPLDNNLSDESHLALKEA